MKITYKTSNKCFWVIPRKLGRAVIVRKRENAGGFMDLDHDLAFSPDFNVSEAPQLAANLHEDRPIDERIRDAMPSLADLDAMATPPSKEWLEDKGWKDYDG